MQLFVGKPVVDRHEGQTGPGGTEKRDGQGNGGDIDHGHVFDIRLAEVSGGRACPFVQLPDGESAVGRAEGDPVAEASRGHLQQHHQVHRGGLRLAAGISQKRGAAWLP